MKKINKIRSYALIMIMTSFNISAQKELKVFEPGDIEINTEKIVSSRVDLIDNYGGSGYTSIDHGIYNNKHVFIIQSWFLQKKNYLDYIIVDAKTFEVLYRTAPIQRSKDEDMISHQVKNEKQYITKYSNGIATTKEVKGGSYFNIAAIPHLLSSMTLKKGMNFKLKTFNPYNGKVAEPEFKVSGNKKIVDKNGVSHIAWVVDNIAGKAPKGHPKEGVVLGKTSYFISSKAPYYLGMEMYRIKSQKDFTLTRGYTQTIKGFHTIKNAPSAKDIKKFIQEN